MNYLKRLEDEVSAWPNVSVHPHRFGGREFRFGRAEIGHVHKDGTVDIPFPRAVRDALLEEGQAEEHRWVPDSGWTTFRVRHEAEVGHAVGLMRVSYLRYALKSACDPHEFLKQESETLHLSPRLISLLEIFAPWPA
jgi:luciferase-like monooxygenase